MANPSSFSRLIAQKRSNYHSNETPLSTTRTGQAPIKVNAFSVASLIGNTCFVAVIDQNNHKRKQMYLVTLYFLSFNPCLMYLSHHIYQYFSVLKVNIISETRMFVFKMGGGGGGHDFF